MVAVVHSTTRYTKYYSIRVPPIDRPFLQLTNLWLLSHDDYQYLQRLVAAWSATRTAQKARYKIAVNTSRDTPHLLSGVLSE